MKLKGRVRLISCDAIRYPKYEDVQRAIQEGQAVITPWMWNLIPTAGRTAICRRLWNAGTKTNEGIITYGAVGTGTTAAANSDIKLETELDRKLIALASNVDNVLTIRTYFTTTEANGNLREFGLFGEDASASADSGTLFERLAITKNKTSAETLTIESEITLS